MSAFALVGLSGHAMSNSTNPWGLGYGVTPTNSPSMPSSSSGLLLIATGSGSAAAASIAFSAFSASFVSGKKKPGHFDDALSLAEFHASLEAKRHLFGAGR